MKNIKVFIKNVSCDQVEAHVIMFDCDNQIVFNQPLSYPTNYTKEEIASIIPNSLPDFSVVVEWVGGRPNDRR